MAWFLLFVGGNYNFCTQIIIMSQAFVKENEEQWLHEIQPTVQALLVYLSRENNNIRVNLVNSFIDEKDGREKFKMSNGLIYSRDNENKWEVVG